ncbi:hypothetical protein [Brevibacillus porteri]|uniref:hypothetical protein n=1 Tax=Brevibacillus porteri TaxID=2126350 RepID=UPI003D215CAA
MTKEEREWVKNRFAELKVLTNECNACGECENCGEHMTLAGAMEGIRWDEDPINRGLWESAKHQKNPYDPM